MRADVDVPDVRDLFLGQAVVKRLVAFHERPGELVEVFEDAGRIISVRSRRYRRQ